MVIKVEYFSLKAHGRVTDFNHRVANRARDDLSLPAVGS